MSSRARTTVLSPCARNRAPTARLVVVFPPPTGPVKRMRRLMTLKSSRVIVMDLIPAILGGVKLASFHGGHSRFADGTGGPAQIPRAARQPHFVAFGCTDPFDMPAETKSGNSLEERPPT